MKTDFVSSVSHELRTPVAVVRSSQENLHAARTPEETRVYVARADEGLERLDHLQAHGDSDHAFGWKHLKGAQLWKQRTCGPLAAE